MSTGDDRTSAVPQSLLDAVVGDPIVVANEFSATEVHRIETRNGTRLLITSTRTGRWITLDALEVEALTWQNTATLEAMISNPNAPLVPDSEGDR
ncbi:dihydrodiol dehydrogenase [Mycolicibacterium gadium]|uniref:Dihydrodiol dehydrogenase n=1 Tax=Mycolicibacterium gadium TaxID=1794 RepID=A0ABT6GJ07_MYCGU|nr:dihydrodiol dehydrogenase [Mycolicibacterium gadium]MDG5481229.1 dihydrodiol dehydrogenase [Mycolicibacterium gadium]